MRDLTRIILDFEEGVAEHIRAERGAAARAAQSRTEALEITDRVIEDVADAMAALVRIRRGLIDG